jgi:hypothetical protein
MHARNWLLFGALAIAMPVLAQDGARGGPPSATFFGKRDFQARGVTVDRPVRSFREFDMNDKISSIAIQRGRWLVCEDDDFRGRCQVIDRDMKRLDRIGMGEMISSARPLGAGDGGGDRGGNGGGGNGGGSNLGGNGRPGGGGFGGGYGGGNGASLPGGSWARSCRGAQGNGSVMAAQCRDTNGRWRDTRITPRACRSGLVGNRDGELVCE